MIYRSLIVSAVLALPLAAQAGGGRVSCVAPDPARHDHSYAVDVGDFAVRVPVGDSAIHVPGLDSQTGGWGRDGMRLVYDYGSYSNPLDSLPELFQVHRSRITIGGRAAVLVTASDSANRLVVAAHWPSLRSSSTGPISLTFYGTAADTARRRDLVDIICSLRFMS